MVSAAVIKKIQFHACNPFTMSSVPKKTLTWKEKAAAISILAVAIFLAMSFHFIAAFAGVAGFYAMTAHFKAQKGSQPQPNPITTSPPSNRTQLHPNLMTADLPADVKASFQKVTSNHLLPVQGSDRADFRAAFKRGELLPEPVVISKSDFVPANLVRHLMLDKKPLALNVKYLPGDSITNMEGAMHTFMTPVCPVTMTADYAYRAGHTGLPLPKNWGRPVILSAAIHPDFEMGQNDEVMMRIVEAKTTPIDGTPLPADFKPLCAQHRPGSPEFEQHLVSYERQLQQHMVYHLKSDHKLPALHAIKAEDILDYNQALRMLEALIKGPDFDPQLKDKYIQLNGHTLSLDCLFHVYLHQMRNEFSLLENTLTQGYVYTVDPPSIFAAQIGTAHVALLNRLQILALKQIQHQSPFNNLKVIGFNNYADQEAVPLLQQIFSNKSVVTKAELFQAQGHYSNNENWALVLHNNSDGFGRNIETEGPTSMDGVIGTYSNASCQLDPTNPRLLAYVY